MALPSSLAEVCGIIHSPDIPLAHDEYGCRLKYGHSGPHEFVTEAGRVDNWETDFECTCDWCERCEGDYCTLYWEVKP